MATYTPAKRATEYIFYVGLRDQSDTKLFKSSPTLAAGDVKVSKDGGSLANITTLPTVTPAAGKMVKVTLSATEMTADNVTVVFSDASGSEWCDLIVNIHTASNQFDDLSTFDSTTDGVDATSISGSATTANLLEDFYATTTWGTAQSGATSSVVLAAGETTDDAQYSGGLIYIKSGTGAGQIRLIRYYYGPGKTAYVSRDWATVPDNTSGYVIFPALGLADLHSIADSSIGLLYNMQDFYDGTGYDGANNTIGTVTTLTGHTAQTGDSYARLGAPAGASVSADIAAIEAQTDDIGAAGAGLTAVPWNSAWDSEVLAQVNSGLDATVADSVPADGSRPSLRQGMYMTVQYLYERSTSGTTCTVKKADGTTTLATLTLDSATAPTSITRAT